MPAPPDGRIDSAGLAVCASLQYAVMVWPDRVTGSNARADADETLRRASPASIVLAHDGGPQPNAPLMQQLDRLAGSMTDAGYTLCDRARAAGRPGAGIRGRLGVIGGESSVSRCR